MGTENKSDRDDKEYSFIQEKIVPKARNSKKKRLKHVAVTVSLAVVFGLVSSLVFNLSNYCFNHAKKADKETVTLEQNKTVTEEPETTLSAEESESNITEKDKDSELTDYQIAGAFDIRSYQKIFSIMTDISDELKYSMVTVVSYEDITSWLELESTKTSYGLIVADDDDNVYILCSYAKIKAIDKIKIKFYNEDTLTASVCGYDKDTDIGVLQVEKEKLSKRTSQKIKKAVLGDSYQMSTGTPVLALGSPNGYVYSMLMGYITDPGIDKYIVDGKLEMFHTNIEEQAGGEGFFVNLSGQVIGVLTHDFREDSDGEIMSFIGISRLRTRIEDIINDRKQTYFGIKAYELTGDEAKTFNVNYGIYVTDVIADSPAFNQGIKSGDVITEVDGKSISSVSALSSILRTHVPGDKIKIKITRQSKDEYPKISFPEMTISVTLGEKPSSSK